MTSLLLRQTKALLYRNYLLKKRLKSPTLQEFFFPLYFVLILVILKSVAYKPTYYLAEDNNQSLSLRHFQANPNTTFYVAPDVTNVRRLMNGITYGNPDYTYRLFISEIDAEQAYAISGKSNVVGLYFKNTKTLTNYVLRFEYDKLPEAQNFHYDIVSCRRKTPFSYCPAEGYLTSGFVFIQNLIDTAIVKASHRNHSYTAPNVFLQRFPRESGFSNIEIFQVVSAVYLVISFSPFMSILMVMVVHEKEKKIREGMKMMGLESVALWTAWGLTYGTVVLLLTVVITLLAKFGLLYGNSNFLIIFLIFFLYGLSIVSFGFMLTPFFRNAKAAGTFGGLLSFVLGGLSIIPIWIPTSNGAMWAISVLEVLGGADFSNIWQGPAPLAISLVMLLVDIFLYFVLTVYLDQVVPGEYGQRRSPLFFMQPSFWCPAKPSPFSDLGHKESAFFNLGDCETVSDELVGKEAIRIHSITKIFGSDGICARQSTPTTAVKNFSLDIYEGQITALLGHNGAGKTTLCNILTGFVDATSGFASAYGYDVSNAATMSKIRQMTGVCPQLDILLDVLSVQEHLELFSGIKGFPKQSEKDEIERVITLVGLETQRDTYAKKLSGGQKRKLSVGIAILGDPKILILDEPTAGMDPFSRNNLWDVLRSRKEGRVTLLTTHFMDEADILADRKAIISCGRLRCVGSSLYLKNKFGAGYHLGVVTRVSGADEPITDCVKSHVTGAEFQRSVGFELDYTLPLAEIQKFADLFLQLERRKAELSIQSFGVSMTTLEEVFLAIGEEDEAGVGSKEEGDLTAKNSQIRDRLLSKTSSMFFGGTYSQLFRLSSLGGTASTTSAFSPSLSEVGKRSRSAYYKALVKRLVLLYYRNPGSWVFGLLLPIALTISSAALLSLANEEHNDTDPPAVVISPALYDNKLLVKNSTGSSLTTLLGNTKAEVKINDLSNLSNQTDTYYMASDVLRYDDQQVSYKALYNTKALHALPSIVNFFSSSVLSRINGNVTEIVTQQKKWPQTASAIGFDGGLFGGTIMAGVAMVLVTSIGALMPVWERELRISALMRVSGVRFGVYWTSSFTVDYAWYSTVALTLVVSLKAFGVDAVANTGATIALILLLIGWGASSILTSYCASFMFKRHEVAQAVMPNLVQWIAVLPFVPVSLLDQLGFTRTAMAINILSLIVIPYYAGFSGFYYLVKVYSEQKVLLGNSNVPLSVYFDWSEPIIPSSILITYVHFILFLILLRIISIKHDGGSLQDFWKIKARPRSVRDVSANQEAPATDALAAEDDDVVAEKEKVFSIVNHQAIPQEQPVVLLHDLRKEFLNDKENDYCKGSKKDKAKVAVDQLSLTVNRGQVLGLLGPNGAGKTTAMNLITADFAPTSGRIFVSGQEVLSNMSEAFMDMGYCPQINPLWDDLTLAEHLEIYAATQGIKKRKVKRTIDRFVDELGIREHVNKKAKSLSGGTKRKLCFAIAMLGNPQVVLLDEPSTGMDPKTKRFMWDTISRAFQGTNRGAILTTHYMEEADALCSRVAIMVLGKLRCLGSTQHLKSKFGQGYNLEIKLKQRKELDDEPLRQFVCKLFPGVGEPEQSGNRYVYKISQSSVVSLSSVFREMEEAKQELGIEEYSFSQSTLEQVFLQFAREQEMTAEADEVKI